MKLELVKRMAQDNAVCKIFKIADYTVEYAVYNVGTDREWKTIYINSDYSKEYLPGIHFTGKRYGETLNEFTIQTTSYGSLKPEEIKEVMKGYETALAVVEILKKELFK